MHKNDVLKKAGELSAHGQHDQAAIVCEQSAKSLRDFYREMASAPCTTINTHDLLCSAGELEAQASNHRQEGALSREVDELAGRYPRFKI
jgi:hypothetical protein